MGTDRITFEMAIPESLLTRNILEASYYNHYDKMLTSSNQSSASASIKSSGSGKSASRKRKGESASTGKGKKQATGSKKSESGISKPKAAISEETTEATPDSQVERDMLQQAIEESQKVSDRPPVKGVSIIEPEATKAPQMEHVEGKGKEAVTEEQAAQTLLKIAYTLPPSPQNLNLSLRSVPLNHQQSRILLRKV